MKKPLTITLLFTILFGMNAHGQSCYSQEMSADLEAAYASDQEIRMEVMELVSEYQKTGKGAMQLFGLKNKMDSIDEANRELLNRWMDKCSGWPDDLTPEAHNAVFMILHHGDLEGMTSILEEVKRKADLGLLSPDDYALMSDRIAMREGRAQHYGTQTFQSPDGNNTVWPVMSVDSLDIYRAEVGLPPMKD